MIVGVSGQRGHLTREIPGGQHCGEYGSLKTEKQSYQVSFLQHNFMLLINM